MTRSLTAMRVWLHMEGEDIARAHHKHGFTRAQTRELMIERIGIEMRLDNYKPEDYQADIDEIVDSVLDELYGETRNEDMAKVAREDMQAKRDA